MKYKANMIVVPIGEEVDIPPGALGLKTTMLYEWNKEEHLHQPVSLEVVFLSEQSGGINND